MISFPWPRDPSNGISSPGVKFTTRHACGLLLEPIVFANRFSGKRHSAAAKTMKPLGGNVSRADWRSIFDPSGRKLAGSAGHEARVWDSETGKILLEENDEAAVAHGVSFDHVGDFFVSAWTGRVKVWDLRTGAQVNDVPISAGSGAPVLTFNADNSRLVVEDAALPDALRTLVWRSDDVVREACRHVAFNLSPEDWKRLGGYYMPTEPTCPGLPAGQ